MKKTVPALIAILCAIGVFAQSPEKMSYQAVIRDADDALLSNQIVGMQISILQGTASGTPVYEEIQTPTTNDNGLLSIEIGGGTVVSGSIAAIDWANGPYRIKTEIDLSGGTDYTISGTSQLLSVPYALHARTAENLSGEILDAAIKAYVDELEAKLTAMLKLINPDFFKVSDVDGNTYNVVIIDTKVWMAENLKTTRYNDGTPILLVTDSNEWINLSSPAYCWYDNDSATYASTFGAMYNWYTAHTGDLCPAGWHVPDDSEWNALIDHLGGEDLAGGKLKETGTTHWSSPNTGASNESSFTALPSGFRSAVSGDFKSVGEVGGWWSATGNEDAVGNGWSTYYLDTKVYHEGYKRMGSAVRCVKD